jgi:hypothetical protein
MKSEILYGSTNIWGWNEGDPFPQCHILADEPSMTRKGLGQETKKADGLYFPEYLSEKSQEIYCPPFNIRVGIDGKEITLRQFSFYDMYGEFQPYPFVHWWIFFQTFEPGFFEPGEHTIFVLFSWYDGYGPERTHIEWVNFGYFWVH